MTGIVRVAFASRALTTFLALIVFQGFHELEHVVQVIQRYGLGIANGNGLVGSLADIEPVHFVYNTGYLLLLAVTYVTLGLHREEGPRHGGVLGLLSLALVLQSWHEVEHIFKLAQYFQLGVNGTGGVFGMGPGAIRPLFPIPLLHLAYNTLAYAPAVVAFAMLVRRERSRVPLAAASRSTTGVETGVAS